MFEYALVFFCSVVFTSTVAYIVLRERRMRENIQERAPYITDYKSAVKAVEEMRKMDITSQRFGNTYCNIMKYVVKWVENNNRLSRSNAFALEKLEIRISEIERLTKKMSVVVLNSQDPQQSTKKPEGEDV